LRVEESLDAYQRGSHDQHQQQMALLEMIASSVVKGGTAPSAAQFNVAAYSPDDVRDMKERGGARALGSGGSAVVVQGRDRAGNAVAIKTLKGQHASDR